MKKMLALFLAVAMTLSLVSCGPKAPTSDGSDISSQGTPGSTSSTVITPEEPGVYIEIPEEYRSWDANGNSVDHTRIANAENGMVASLKYEASAVGRDIMANGGNAIDAAVATALALTVTLPMMCSLGGGGIMIYYDAASGQTVYLSFREVAPKYQTAEMWIEDSEGNIIGDRKAHGGLSVGIPGEVAGLYRAWEDAGSMEWADLVQPSIDLARKGYRVVPEMRECISMYYDNFYNSRELSQIYLTEDGMVPDAGDIIVNEPMAKMLEIIRDQGADGFYSGPLAEAVIKEVQKAGGVMTMEDLAEYEPWYEPPVSCTYRDYTIYSSASPSSGGTFIIETLNILENLPTYEFNSVEYWHQLCEVQKMVWADRAKYMADTRFVDVPIAGLTSKEYAETLAAKVDMTKTQDFSYGNPREHILGNKNTTSFSVADKDGNMCTITHTINDWWGSSVYVNGYGFFMNDQLDDFDAGIGFANSLEPGKAPLSSMSPTVVFDPNGKPFMTLGAPGGAQIYPRVVQAISNVIDYGMDVDSALNTPFIVAMSDVTYYYQNVDKELLSALEALGHDDFAVPPYIAIPSAVMYMPDGTLQGSTEHKNDVTAFNDGCALGF